MRCLFLALLLVFAIVLAHGADPADEVHSLSEISHRLAKMQTQMSEIEKITLELRYHLQELKSVRDICHKSTESSFDDSDDAAASAPAPTTAAASKQVLQKTTDGYTVLREFRPAPISNYKLKRDLLGPKFRHKSEFELCNHSSRELFMDIIFGYLEAQIRFHAIPSKLAPDFVPHSLHVFVGRAEVFHRYSPLWYGIESLEPEDIVRFFPPKDYAPDSNIELWAALVGESEGDLCILSQVHKPVIINSRYLTQVSNVHPDIVPPKMKAIANSDTVSGIPSSLFADHLQNTIFKDKDLLEHAKLMGQRLASQSFVEESDQPRPTDDDHNILKAAWSILQHDNSPIITSEICERVELYHQQSATGPGQINIVVGAAMIDSSCASGSTLQQLTCLVNQKELLHTLASLAIKSRQLRSHHWKEVGMSYLMAKNITIDPQSEEIEPILKLFVEAALNTASSSSKHHQASLLLKTAAATVSTPASSDGIVSPSNTTTLQAMIDALETVLAIMRGENIHSYALVSHKRIQEILEKRAQQHQLELDVALVWNVCHPEVKSVTVVACNKNEANHVLSVKKRWLEHGEQHEKYRDKLNVLLLSTSSELIYRDLFQVAALGLGGQVTAIIKHDVLIGSGLGGRWTDLYYLSDKIVAVSRHGTVNGEPSPCEDSRGGIDAFIFVSPAKDIEFLSSRYYYHNNDESIDYRIVTHLCTRSRFVIYNLCHEVKVYRMHLSAGIYQSNARTPKKPETNKIDPHSQQLPPLGCPPSPKNVEPPYPCCSVKGKMYSYTQSEQIILDSINPELSLVGDRSSRNNSVVENICVQLEWENLINAPERGQDAIYIKSGEEIVVVHSQKSISTCLSARYLRGGPTNATITVEKRPEMIMLLEYFILKDGNEKEACEWVKEKPEVRSIGALSREILCM